MEGKEVRKFTPGIKKGAGHADGVEMNAASFAPDPEPWCLNTKESFNVVENKYLKIMYLN
jgi:hypothetical protein